MKSGRDGMIGGSKIRSAEEKIPPKNPVRRPYGFWILMLVLTLGIGFLVAEVLLRVAGYEPWTFAVRENEPRVYEADPDLGWKNKTGAYRYPGYSPDVSEISLTITGNGSRKTDFIDEDLSDERPKLLLLGGSFIQGWAISDNETFAWKIQQRYRGLKVENFGTGGYGTYQSLLVLERVSTRSAMPRAVIYAFIDDHERRNVGTSWWLRAIRRGSVGKDRPKVLLPYCSLGDGGEIVREEPVSYPGIWRLSFVSSAIDFLQLQTVTLGTISRSFQRKKVTEKLILNMRDLSLKNGSEFFVLFLYFHKDSNREYYKEFLDNEGISGIDCAFKLTDDLHVDGEGHPNGAMNTLWSECVEDAIGARLSSFSGVG